MIFVLVGYVRAHSATGYSVTKYFDHVSNINFDNIELLLIEYIVYHNCHPKGYAKYFKAIIN